MNKIIRTPWLLAILAVATYGRNFVVTLNEPPLGASNNIIRSRAAQDQWNDRKERIQEEQQTLIDNLPEGWKVAKILRENGVSQDAITSVVSNTVTIDVGDETLESVASKLRGVVPFASIEPVLNPKLFLYASRDQIKTEEALSKLGFTEELDAGKGVKIAICDNGNYVNVDMMNDEGFDPPYDLPADVGETENCNNKLIVSKKYGFSSSYQSKSDENHGIHTSSTAGGRRVKATYGGANYTISGVAPGAWMMNYRFVGGNGGDVFSVFDDVVEDGADISSNSWGYDPFYNSNSVYSTIFDNAIESGVVVTEAAGNSGPDQCTVSALSRESIVVGAVSKPGLMGTITLKIKPNMDKSMSCNAYVYGSSQKTFFDTLYIEDLSDISSYDEIDEDTAIFVQLPSGYSMGDVVDIVSNAGAGLLVIGSDNSELQAKFKMPTIVCRSSLISSFGDHYKKKGPGNVTLSSINAQKGDYIADFSSRGPSVDMELTPDVVAPGVDILAAGYCSSCDDPRLGYNQVSGTSMATPHVSGAAAIVLQHHPEFTPLEVRSALMTTAEYKTVMNSVSDPAQPLDMGSGRINLEKAIEPALYIDPPRVDFSVSPRDRNHTREVRVSKYREGTMNIDIKIVKHTGYDEVEPVESYIVATPETLILTDESPEENVSFTLDAEELDLGDQNAYVVFEDADTGDEIAHIPLWGQVTCREDEVKDALLVVLDQTKCNTGLTDVNITDAYVKTLDEMNLTYDIFDYCYKGSSSPEFHLPEKAINLCYKVVIIAASQVNPSKIESGESDVRRMMHAGIPVIQMGGTIGEAWGITKNAYPNTYSWNTNYIMKNEFSFPSPGAWYLDNWVSVTDVDIVEGTKMPKVTDDVENIYSTDGGDVLVSVMRYKSTGFTYSKNFNSVGVTSVVGLDHFIPSSRLEIMRHLYGFSIENISAFNVTLSSNDKILTLDINADTSDGFDHSIYYIEVYWNDKTYNAGNVNNNTLTLAHTYGEYGTQTINIFLVSGYQNVYGFTLTWTLTKGDPVPGGSSLSDMSFSGAKPAGSSSLNSFSKGNSSNEKTINIGWVALIFVACLVILIGSMFLVLKVSARGNRGLEYNELEL